MNNIKPSFFILLFILLLGAVYLGVKNQTVHHVDGSPRIESLERELLVKNDEFTLIAQKKSMLEAEHAQCFKAIDSLKNLALRSNSVLVNNAEEIRNHAYYEELLRKQIIGLQDSLKYAYGVIWDKEQEMLKLKYVNQKIIDSAVSTQRKSLFIDTKIQELIVNEDTFVKIFITHIASKTYQQIHDGHGSEYLPLIKSLNQTRRNLSGWRTDNYDQQYQDGVIKNTFMGRYWYNVEGKYRLAFLVLNFLDNTERPTLPQMWFNGSFEEIQYHFYHTELLPDFMYPYRNHVLINLSKFKEVHGRELYK